MTGKLLPFARPAPRTPKPGTVVRQETTGGGLSFTLQIDTDELARAIPVRETEQLEDESRQDDAGGGDASPVDDTDADGFLYADDDGPD